METELQFSLNPAPTLENSKEKLNADRSESIYLSLFLFLWFHSQEEKILSEEI